MSASTSRIPPMISGVQLLQEAMRKRKLQGTGTTLLEPLDRAINQACPVSTSMESSLNRGDVVEIQGKTGSGKTELLYFLCLGTILPRYVRLQGQRQGVRIDGKNKSVVLCDSERRWDMKRLHHVMDSYLRQKIQETLPSFDTTTHEFSQQLETTIQSSLRRLHIFRPTSSASLAATLLNLPKYHHRQMPKEEVCMLMLDGGLSTFYWQDKWSVESMRNSGSKGTPISPTAGVLRALEAFRTSHQPVIFITNRALHTVPGPSIFYKQHLPQPYPAPFESLPRPSAIKITHHITLFDYEEFIGSEERMLMENEEDEQIFGIMRTPPSQDLPETVVTHFSFMLTDGGVKGYVLPIDELLEAEGYGSSADER